MIMITLLLVPGVDPIALRSDTDEKVNDIFSD